MRKIIVIMLIVILSVKFGNTQTLPQPLPEIASGWERIYIKDIGSFDLPPTMEIQNEQYRTDLKYYDLKDYKIPQLTAQPRGTNEFEKEGWEKYARIIIETNIGTPGEFDKLNFNLNDYTKADIVELNNMFKQQCQRALRTINIKLVEWYPMELKKINGMSCMHIGYKRQLKDNPYVLVHSYWFPNNDRIHKFTLSYRLSEESIWKSDFVKVLNSFRITNINK
jgi:hypothetical protein